MNVTTLAPWRRGTLRRSLERNHLERHAKHLGRFLSQRPIRADLVICPAQSTPDDLLTQELRQKRAKTDDVRHCVAVPPFSQHPHADDAPHVSTWRMIGSSKLLRQFFEPIGVHRMTHAISRPRGLAYGIEDETHPTHFVGLGLAGVRFMHDFGIHADRVAPAVVLKSFDLHRWNARRRTILRQPFIEDFGNLRVLTHENEHRWSWVVSIPAPLLAFFFPESAEHGDGMVRIFQNRFRFRIGLPAAAFGGSQLRYDPVPDIEIPGNFFSRRIPNRKLRNFHQTGFDGVN